VFSLNRKGTEKLAQELTYRRKDLTKHLPEVINSAKKLSGYLEPAGTNNPVFTGRIQREGYIIEKYFIKGEGDYVIPYLLLIPLKPNNKAIIYLHPSGKSAEASAGGEMEWFVNNGFTVLAPDLIGTGETGPGVFHGDAFIEGNSHNLWYASMLIGRSILGIRTGDVVRLRSLLRNSNEVYGVARKEMCPVLVHAAAFDTTIKRIALIEPYSSYQSIVMNRFYRSQFVHSLVPGALMEYDLPDLEAGLAPRKLLIAGVTDGNGHENPESSNNDLSIVKAAYQNRDSKNLTTFGKLSNSQLMIVPVIPNEKPDTLYREWIK